MAICKIPSVEFENVLHRKKSCDIVTVLKIKKRKKIERPTTPNKYIPKPIR